MPTLSLVMAWFRIQAWAKAKKKASHCPGASDTPTGRNVPEDSFLGLLRPASPLNRIVPILLREIMPTVQQSYLQRQNKSEMVALEDTAQGRIHTNERHHDRRCSWKPGWGSSLKAWRYLSALVRHSRCVIVLLCLPWHRTNHSILTMFLFFFLPSFLI